MSATTSTSAAPQRSAKSKLLGVAAVILVVVGGGIYAQRARPAVDAPPTFAGNVDIRDVTLAFRVGGRVAAVLKKEGDRVQAGEVLAYGQPALVVPVLDSEASAARGLDGSVADSPPQAEARPKTRGHSAVRGQRAEYVGAGMGSSVRGSRRPGTEGCQRIQGSGR